MITSDVDELNIDDLHPFEGDPSVLLTENPEGLWKKLKFDPTSATQNPSNVLTLHEGKIILGPAGGGGGTPLELQGDVTGVGVTGTPINTEIQSLSTGITIPDQIQDFFLPGGFGSSAQQVRYSIKEASMPFFNQTVQHASTSRQSGFKWAFENGKPNTLEITTSDNGNAPIATFSKDSASIKNLVVDTLANPTSFTTGQQFYGPGYIAASDEWPGRGGNVYNNYISAIFGGYFGGDYGFIACGSDIIQIIADGNSGYLFGGTDEDTLDPATQLTFGIDKAGAYKQLSDKSMKHSIHRMKEKVLPKIKGLKLNTYGFLARYDEKDSDDKKKRKAKGFFKKHLGLVADEVEEVLPEIVQGLGYLSKKEAETNRADPNLVKMFQPDETKSKTKMLNMTHLQLYMLKAIQELAETVDSLQGIKPKEVQPSKRTLLSFFKRR